jgi:hypothetical protein
MAISIRLEKLMKQLLIEQEKIEEKIKKLYIKNLSGIELVKHIEKYATKGNWAKDSRKLYDDKFAISEDIEELQDILESIRRQQYWRAR